MEILLGAGKKGVEIGFYILLPIMVVMMAFMRVLEKKGILAKIALWLSPLMLIFGLPGIGVFAMLQLLLVSFAAPLSTLHLLEQDHSVQKRKIAATLALIYTMSQANASFPLAAVGLNLPFAVISSLAGGFLASSLTYYVFCKKKEYHETLSPEGHTELSDVPKEKSGLLKILFSGSEEGLQMVLKSIPILTLAIVAVDFLKKLGVIGFLEKILTPAFSLIGLTGVSVLPILTKFVAGGTAMMGVAIELVNKGAMSAVELNRIAGLVTHPFDLVGIAFYATAGPRTASVVKPAVKGALAGILLRSVMHLIYF